MLKGDVKMLSKKYHEIYGLYFEGGEERTRNIETEIAQLEDECRQLLKTSIALYKQIESSPDVCNLDEFDRWEDALAKAQHKAEP